MIDLSNYLAFVAASCLILIIPGPTITLIVARAASHGRMTLAPAVAGVALGDLLAASISLAGVGVLLAASATLFEIVRYAGAAWLIVLSIRLWRSGSSNSGPAAHPKALSPRRLFTETFFVTLLNPKGILFFVAFVPLFISENLPFLPQAVVLVLTFVLLGIVNAALYGMLAGWAHEAVRSPAFKRGLNRFGAVALAGSAAMAIATRRP
ncbi:LysE family translocator [Notoacmeibacter sp. MSK16QG-6]|uniref:LysE family translocator n=1 Tax=Notoacmeibacter sp. MSK16QG-6 TaxID=2957982 RepID=UPI00209ECE09|nr:LysE family translocator [Notoacmeibacter sp. MSK16QG-6]MCP1200156.1 LysE family translocator [Notoacmeibacter sp. MSK16QG-6]